MINIFEVQDIISKHKAHVNYKFYKVHEISYWEKVMNWIYEIDKTNIDILDIGCAYGTLGMYTKLNKDGNLYAVDFVKYISDELIKDFDINYNICNFEKDNFPFDKQFDIIIFTEILEHLNGNPKNVMLKIRELLKDDGTFFISTPNSNNWGKLPQYDSWKNIPNIEDIKNIEDRHIYQYNRQEVEELLQECGFKVIKYDESTVTYQLTNMNFMIKKV